MNGKKGTLKKKTGTDLSFASTLFGARNLINHWYHSICTQEKKHLIYTIPPYLPTFPHVHIFLFSSRQPLMAVCLNGPPGGKASRRMKPYCMQNPVPTAMIDRWNNPRQSSQQLLFLSPMICHQLSFVHPNFASSEVSRPVGSGFSALQGEGSSPCRIDPRGGGPSCVLCFLNRNQALRFASQLEGMVGRLSRACHAWARPCRCPSVNQTARAVAKGEALTIGRHGRRRARKPIDFYFIQADRRHCERRRDWSWTDSREYPLSE